MNQVGAIPAPFAVPQILNRQKPALWAAVEALNILLDAALVFVLSLIVWGLKLGVPKKIVLSIAFASRLL